MNRVKLSDIASFNARNADYKGKFETISYIDTSAVTEGIFDEAVVYQVGRDSIPSRAQRAVEDGTILVSTVRPNLKHYGILRNPSENTVASTGFVTLDAKPGIVDADYLYYLVTSPAVQSYLEKVSASATSSYPSFNPADLETLEVSCHGSLSEQKRTAGVLRSLDAAIANNSSICTDLDAAAKLLYDYWFVQFDFPDENGKPYKSSGGKMVWNEELKREIPAGWKAGSLSDVLNRYCDTIGDDCKSDLPYTPLDLLPCHSMSFSPTGDNAGANSSLIKYDKYTLLFGAMRPYFHKVCIAPCDAITRSTVFTFHSNEDELGYAYETLNQDYCVKYATMHSVGTQQPYAEWEGNFENCPIPLPPKQLRVEFSTIIHPLIEAVIDNQLLNGEMKRIRDFLLPLLMNGQVTIEDGSE